MFVVLSQLLFMIKFLYQRIKDDYCFEELLILLIYIYFVSGEFIADKNLGEVEENVKKILVQVFCEEFELLFLL